MTKAQTEHTVWVGFTPYQISRIPDYSSDAGRFGFCDFVQQEIRISDDIADETEITTLLHEAGHGAMFVAGHNAFDEDEGIIVEKLLDVLSANFVAIARDQRNDWLTARVLGISEEALASARSASKIVPDSQQEPTQDPTPPREKRTRKKR